MARESENRRVQAGVGNIGSDTPMVQTPAAVQGRDDLWSSGMEVESCLPGERHCRCCELVVVVVQAAAILSWVRLLGEELLDLFGGVAATSESGQTNHDCSRTTRFRTQGAGRGNGDTRDSVEGRFVARLELRAGAHWQHASDRLAGQPAAPGVPQRQHHVGSALSPLIPNFSL